ncbi:M10 family metallopeptidase [Aquabacter cavernae]|uniref:M10 family metallopeptidase n=1 Tax=Aquabacter cavernae TaxID=2496029 RepID=UPI000F8D6F8D|nr:M10 family metallopeptidase [Aquabacter cavernae]
MSTVASDNDDTDADGWIPAIFSLPKGGLYSGSIDTSTLDPNTRAVMMDYRWTTSYGGDEAATVATYAFPTSTTDYTNVAGGYPAPNLLTGFQEVTDAQKAAVKTAFDLVSSYTNLTFVEATSASAQDATFRFAQYSQGGSESNFPANSGPYSPSDSRAAGDTYLGGNGNPPTDYFGTDHFNTIMHEMGHAFGLKHGHDASFNGALAPDKNDNEFSVMTYASYFGADTNGATEAWVGSAPQSYMMYDIAALQAYYGANFSKVGTEAVYTWDNVTGEQFINGVRAANTGVSSTGKIFSTVWTEGALTTYDLSNFNEDQYADLRAGHWFTFSKAQLADLNNMAPQGTEEYQAQGNIYNSLVYQGDTRSLISNVITGDGNDTITGNELDNTLTAGGGNDTIFGGAGNDTISGGAGADIVTFGTGINVLRDQVADLNGDIVMDLNANNSVDLLGVLAGRTDFDFVVTTDATTVSIDGASFELRGGFSGGAFMATARGGDVDPSTSLTFVDYLPTLQEGVAVDVDLINGIVNTPFLTGDGTVTYSVTMESAISAYSNMIGAYSISVDGTISDVHVLFADSLASIGQTLDIGALDAGAQLGFFLVQDGFDLFGALPDDLSFVTSGGGSADVDDGTLLLYSASRGYLSGAEIFHSTAGLNAGGYAQVLSGTTADGYGMRYGFEDISQDLGDNDFQDVVLTVRDSSAFYII